MMTKNLIPTAEPFLFLGGDTGCLLVHGITATPKEMRYLGEYLARQGHTVLGVRLAGHATRPADLRRVAWQDWMACVEDGWHMLRGRCQRVFVVGLSMGGALSLLFSAQFPVSGVFAMAVPCDVPVNPLQRRLLPYLKLIGRLRPYVRKGKPDWFNKAAFEARVAYPVNVLPAIKELDGLLKAMRASLPLVQVPVLLMHSRDDDYVPPEHMERIFAALGSADKQMQWVEHSDHVITEDGERERVFEAAAAFISRVSAD